jgi:hypothetical protein
LPPQILGALGRSRWRTVRFLKDDGLASSNGEAILHVPSNEVTFNAVVIACDGFESPEEHRVLVCGTLVPACSR